MSLTRKAVNPRAGKHKQRLIVADWDGTLRPGFMLRDWLRYLSERLVIQDFYPSMFEDSLKNYESGTLSYDDFASHVLKLYADSLAGISTQDVECCAREFVDQDIKRLFAFVPELIDLASRKSIEVAIVSGGPGVVLREYGARLGIRMIWAVDIATSVSGFYKNEVIRNMAGPKGKEWAIEQIKKQGFEIFIALGDTASDKPLLTAAQHPFAISEDRNNKSSRLLREIAPIINPLELIEELEGVV